MALRGQVKIKTNNKAKKLGGSFVAVALVFCTAFAIVDAVKDTVRATDGTLNIASISPNSGQISGGEIVTITGTNFKQGSWKQISTRQMHTCAIASDNQTYCWGWNYYGQLGNGLSGSDTDLNIPVAVDTSGVLNGKTILQISTGDSHTCAIASDNQAYCWGNNMYSQLGNGNNNDSSVPVAVDTSGVLNGKTVLQISTGYYHTCVIASDNQAYCWGYNFRGELGNGNYTASTVPVAVDTNGVLNGKTVLQISTGHYRTCVTASDNQAYCWGDGLLGELGNGNYTTSSVPTAINTSGVLNGKTILQVSVGGSQTCAIASDNQAYCWGWNSYGQLGNGNNTASTVPVAVDTSGALNGKTILQTSIGNGYTCVIASDNQVYCWGYNYHGQLGNGNNITSNVPVIVDTSSLPLHLLPIITIGGSACTDVTVVSDTQLTCIVPSGTAGFADVVIALDGQHVTLAGGYEYLDSRVVPAPPNTGIKN